MDETINGVPLDKGENKNHSKLDPLRGVAFSTARAINPFRNRLDL